MSMTTALNVRDSENVVGKYRSNIVDWTMDTSYPTGGYALDPTDFGFKVVYFMAPVGANAAAGAYTFIYIVATGKLAIYAAGVEVAAGVNLSTVIVRGLVLGF